MFFQATKYKNSHMLYCYKILDENKHFLVWITCRNEMKVHLKDKKKPYVLYGIIYNKQISANKKLYDDESLLV